MSFVCCLCIGVNGEHKCIWYGWNMLKIGKPQCYKSEKAVLFAYYYFIYADARRAPLHLYVSVFLMFRFFLLSLFWSLLPIDWTQIQNYKKPKHKQTTMPTNTYILSLTMKTTNTSRHLVNQNSVQNQTVK